MPGANGAYAFRGSNRNEEESAADVEKESQGEAGKDAERTAHGGKGIKLAEEEGNHECRLEGADAATGFVNAHHPGADLDDITMLDSGDAEQAKEFTGGRDVELFEGLSEGGFEARGPRDGDEEKAEGKKETTGRRDHETTGPRDQGTESRR